MAALAFVRVGIPLFHTEQTWSRRPGYPALIRRYDALLVNTEHERRFVETFAPGGPMAHVTGVGIDPAVYANRDGAGLRARLGLGDAPLVGYVGRIDPAKGVVTVIEAMARVWTTCPEARLLLAGKAFRAGTRAYEAVAEALSRLAPADRGRIVQLEDLDDHDKASVFDALDVYAMPSIAESFGITYMEAWLCRKPVIGADVAVHALRDPRRRGRPPRRSPRFRRARPRDRRAPGRPAERARMGQAGYERTVGERTWDRVTGNIEGVYASLVEARRRRSPWVSSRPRGGAGAVEREPGASEIGA